jgi:hypothetical protein
MIVPTATRWTGFVNTGLVSSNRSQGLLRLYGIVRTRGGPPLSLARPGDLGQMTTAPCV